MQILYPLDNQRAIVAQSGDMAEAPFSFNLLINPISIIERLERIFIQNPRPLGFEAKALNYLDESTLLAMETRLSHVLAETVNEQIRSRIRSNPLADKINLIVSLERFVDILRASLPPRSEFQILVKWEGETIHRFIIAIHLPDASNVLQKPASTKSVTHPSLEPVKAEDHYLILYSDEENVLPFYLKTGEVSDFDRWVNKRDKNWTLLTEPRIEITDLEEDTQYREAVTNLFDFKDIHVIPTKDAQQCKVTMTTTRIKIPLEKELLFTVRIQLGSLINPESSPGLTLPVILKPKAFAGVVALDFGTTNSACVYVNPAKMNRALEPRGLSSAQVSNLGRIVDEYILKPLEKEEKYKVLLESLITTARSTLHHRFVNNLVIRTTDDIRTFMQTVANSEVENEQIVKLYTEFLFNWVNSEYRILATDQPAIAAALAELYYNCIQRIIDVDIQEDFSIHLAELEAGSLGEISSAVRMDHLKKSDNKLILPYSIDGYGSVVCMGQSIENEMSSVTSEPSENDLPQVSSGLEVSHDRYLTGLKRHIGSETLVEFIDTQGNSLEDCYDPLAFLAIRYILDAAEKKIKRSINDIVITYPANWPQHRRKELRNMVRACGIRMVDDGFDEATAGALYYIWRELLTDQFTAYDGFLARSKTETQNRNNSESFYQNYLVFDMGGGTTDIALLEICLEEKKLLARRLSGKEGRYFELKPTILGLTGADNYGGDNVTRSVFRLLKSKLAVSVLSSLGRTESFSIIDSDYRNNPEKLLEWTQSNDYDEYYDKVSDIIDEIVPTRFRKAPKRRNAFFRLWQEAERVKKHLSDETKGFPEEALAIESVLQSIISENEKLEMGSEIPALSIFVKSSEMEQLIEKDINKVFGKAQNLAIKEGKPTREIHKVILTGNSSKLRIVKNKVKDVLGTSVKKLGYTLPPVFKYDESKVIFNTGDAKLAVARGACLPGFLKRIDTGMGEDAQRQLRDGKYFLSFNVDNIRNHVPFSVGYLIGTGNRNLAFRIGEELKHGPDKDIPYKRKKIPVGNIDILHCVRLEDESDYSNHQYIGSFYIQEVAKKLEAFSKEELPYVIYLDIDSNRDLSCYLVKKKIREHFNKTPDEIAMAKYLLIDELPSGKFDWKENLTITCDSHYTSQDQIAEEAIEDKLDLRKANNLDLRSKYYIRLNGRLVWSFNVQKDEINNPELAGLELKFGIEDNGVPYLTYGIFEPEFESQNEVPMHYDRLLNQSFVFNPFSGDE